jgi:hypothetical protein
MTSVKARAGDRVTAGDRVSGSRSHAHTRTQSNKTGNDVTGCHLSPLERQGGGSLSSTQEAANSIASGDRWGPFVVDIDEAERRARLRALRQTARLLTGTRAADLCRLLALAETDPAALEPACRALNAMAANDKRQIWAAYAALARSAA